MARPDLVPARLHVLLARDATTAVVIRRGPSKHTAVVGWDRRTDRFTVGQWLYGRIYERRCDLSADGAHFLYFAMNGRWDGPAKGSWTAISRAPYLRALTLLPKGDCWNGGGLFLSPKKAWINGGECHGVARDDAGFRREKGFPFATSYGGECPGVYFHRLQRDGWRLVDTGGHRGDAHATFDKRMAAGWTLRKTAHATIGRTPGRGCYFDTHGLLHARRGEEHALADAEWADWDGERLLWAAGGCLHAAHVEYDAVGPARLLHDFNPMRYERLAAPYE